MRITPLLEALKSARRERHVVVNLFLNSGKPIDDFIKGNGLSLLRS